MRQIFGKRSNIFFIDRRGVALIAVHLAGLPGLKVIKTHRPAHDLARPGDGNSF